MIDRLEALQKRYEELGLLMSDPQVVSDLGALQRYPHPASVARQVLERLQQHCLRVGEGAALFARECGFETAELLTEDSRRLFREALRPSEESVEGEQTAAQ